MGNLIKYNEIIAWAKGLEMCEARRSEKFKWIISLCNPTTLLITNNCGRKFYEILLNFWRFCGLVPQQRQLLWSICQWQFEKRFSQDWATFPSCMWLVRKTFWISEEMKCFMNNCKSMTKDLFSLSAKRDVRGTEAFFNGITSKAVERIVIRYETER